MLASSFHCTSFTDGKAGPFGSPHPVADIAAEHPKPTRDNHVANPPSSKPQLSFADKEVTLSVTAPQGKPTILEASGSLNYQYLPNPMSAVYVGMVRVREVK